MVTMAGPSLRIQSHAMDKPAALASFRRIPEKTLREWKYRILGTGSQTLLLIPGGELVNDLAFEFALAIGRRCQVLYPAYPRVSSIEQLADGLSAILDAERIAQAAVLGASFGGAVAQVFARRHPHRVRDLILSNTGVPLRDLARPVRITCWIAEALPWRWTSKLLRKPLAKTMDQAGGDRASWAGYFDELFFSRLSKSDMVANFYVQYDYHRRFSFTAADLKDWHGRVLIAESDNDVIGPRRRKALRETYPQAQVHTFHSAGHAPMFTRYDEYLQMIEEFLSG